MWFCPKKENADNIPASTIVALALAAFGLVLAVGVARWSWFIADEQVRLREDLNRLQNNQDQVNTQYEFWLKRVQEERAALKAEAAPTPKK